MNQYIDNNFYETERKNVAVFSFCQRTQKHAAQFAERNMSENTLMACGGGGGGGGR